MSNSAGPGRTDSLTLGGRNTLRTGDPIEDWSEPFPPREGCRVTPMIEAADMYPAFERMTLAATRSIWLAFRVFDPSTATRSEEAQAAGLTDWTALIRDAVIRGVEIRILLTDFEPVMADDLHAASWQSFNTLRTMVDALDQPERERLQIIVIQHEGEVGWGWRQLLRVPLRIKMRRIAKALLAEAGEDGGLDSRPGFWRHLVWDGGKPSRFGGGPAPRLWPATYHQKFAVIDGERAVIGGLDLDERRYDDRRHRRRADKTWHDISSLVEGPAAGDAACHFADLWNRELPRFRVIVAEWTDGVARRLTLDPLTPAKAPPLPGPIDGGAARVQIARTRSRKKAGAFAFGPRPHVRELKAAHRLLIRAATRRIYVEAQFFRSAAAGRWVATALRRRPELEVIILVANAPEEVAFDGEGANPAHRHGEYLQARALSRILKVGRGRVGIFTLAKQEKLRASEEEFAEHRGSAFGSGLIHIHAKLLIVDDRLALLSSANINGRSFEWDTELGFIWNDAEGVGEFRRRLWAQLLDGAVEADAGLADWRKLAAANRAADPAERRGFVVPYQLARARRFGRPYWFVPDDLV